MKRFILLFAIILAAIAVRAQQNVERPRFFDNWSVALTAGGYYPMCYDLKYLADNHGYDGAVELRKQVTPVFGIGLEADGYYRLQRPERKDPRSLVGFNVHVNLSRLFGRYLGAPRRFEVEAAVMPAWGHLYRGSRYALFPDENYFATKYSLDLNLNLGRNRAWALTLRPAWVFDVRSYPPSLGTPVAHYDGVTIKKSDLQLNIGCVYRFRNHGGRRHFNAAAPVTSTEEVERLSEIVTYLRRDVDQRDGQIDLLRQRVDSLQQELETLKK